ncbi:MAG TPA: transposase [Gallionella sp.]|nr:transposase [Gallionella sp.]
MRYRRNQMPGGTYFFTVTLADRQSHALTDNIELLRASFRRVMNAQTFTIVAMVVLPEHLHGIWTLPHCDTDYAGRWRAIKARFTHDLIHAGVNLTRNAKGEYDLWQRRFWEHTIRDDDDLERHVDYIHYNPVKHGLVSRVAEWQYSSFHRYVRQGLLPEDWAGGTSDEISDQYGEPL